MHTMHKQRGDGNITMLAVVVAVVLALALGSVMGSHGWTAGKLFTSIEKDEQPQDEASRMATAFVREANRKAAEKSAREADKGSTTPTPPPAATAPATGQQPAAPATQAAAGQQVRADMVAPVAQQGSRLTQRANPASCHVVKMLTPATATTPEKIRLVQIVRRKKADGTFESITEQTPCFTHQQTMLDKGQCPTNRAYVEPSRRTGPDRLPNEEHLECDV